MREGIITRYTSNGEFMNSRILKGLSLAESIGGPNLKLATHSHRLAGFSLILQGEYTESYGESVLECKPSSVKFHPAGEAHADFYGRRPVRNFIIEFNPEWLNSTGAAAFVGNSPMLFSNSNISALMMKLRREFHSMSDESQLLVEALTLQLIVETWRSTKKKFADDCPLWLRRAKELLDDRFAETLSLADIAQSVGVHPVYLAHAFKRHYRCSIGEYLRHRRVEFACHKISTSEDSLVDIALACGFSNQSHFSRIFKQITGLSPGQYRAARGPA